MAKHVVQGGGGGQIMWNSFMLEVSGSLCSCLTKNLFSAHAPLFKLHLSRGIRIYPPTPSYHSVTRTGR